MSSIGYRGVYETSYGGTWFASVKHDGRSHYLGTFPNAESAARAYDRAALSLKGDRARLNFPSESDGIVDDPEISEDHVEE
jgi:EREBP-like factor